MVGFRWGRGRKILWGISLFVGNFGGSKVEIVFGLFGLEFNELFVYLGVDF